MLEQNSTPPDSVGTQAPIWDMHVSIDSMNLQHPAEEDMLAVLFGLDLKFES